MSKRQIAVAFGQVLREIREKKGLSQEGLALQGDLDRTFVGMIERGVRQPTLQTLFTLSETLNVKPSRLIRLLEERLGHLTR